MENREIMVVTDPSILKNRVDEIDRELGQLQTERLIVALRFQTLLKQSAVTPTDIPVKPLYDPATLTRTGFEDSPTRSENS
jgi:hypothetical protein